MEHKSPDVNWTQAKLEEGFKFIILHLKINLKLIIETAGIRALIFGQYVALCLNGVT